MKILMERTTTTPLGFGGNTPSHRQRRGVNGGRVQLVVPSELCICGRLVPITIERRNKGSEAPPRQDTRHCLLTLWQNKRKILARA